MTPQTPRSAQPLNTQQAAAQKAAAEQATAEKAAAAKASAAKAAAEKAEAAAKEAAEQQAAAEQNATAATEATAEAGSSVNPWLIGGGVLAAVGIGAAASGGSDNKSSDNPISQTPSPGTDKGNTTQPDTSVTPDRGTNPPAPGTGSGDTGAGTGDTGNAGNGAGGTEQPGGQTPAPTPNQPHTAGGTPNAPVVAHNAITNLSEASFSQSLADGANAVKIVRVLSAEGQDADGRLLHFFKDQGTDRLTAYEVIEIKEGITWHEAVDRAAAMGGKLLTIDSAEEARALADNLSSRMPDTPYDAQSLAANGAWIGLSQTADASAPNAGWHWQGGKAFSAADWQTYGFSLDGHKMPSDGNLTGGPATEANQANFGVLTAAYQAGTNGGEGSFTQSMISDFGNKDTKLTRFVIEYENYEHPLKLSSEGQTTSVADGQVIQAADLGKLSWASLLNSGGTIQIIGVKVDENGNALKDDSGNDQTVAGTAHTITLTEQAAGSAASSASAVGTDLGRLISATLDDQTLLLS